MSQKEIQEDRNCMGEESSLTPLTRGDKGGLVIKHLPYNLNLKSKARENRTTGCLPEVRIWRYILSRKQTGYKFLRQKPVDRYIVDFYCSKLKLAVEIDGDGHADQTDYDIERSNRLKLLGIEVVRYFNNDVMCRLDGVYNDLMSRIRERERELGITPLCPPLSGG